VGKKHEDYITEHAKWIALSSATGLPSTVAPIGLASDGLPVGLQIISAPYHDFTSIAFATHLNGLIDSNPKFPPNFV
jgi:Asp-tRNA(Asn)/Glu-tRNA(Gln) amidotransferase A subunit family amidase